MTHADLLTPCLSRKVCLLELLLLTRFQVDELTFELDTMGPVLANHLHASNNEVTGEMKNNGFEVRVMLFILAIFVASPKSEVACRPLLLHRHHRSTENGLLFQSLPNGLSPPSKGSHVHT
ncbi:hypothetical protein VNO77_17387 [Canavalia gladiata]|uniref:Uncharacterized protein n=1 Tax=Canavalia gladiata TaxID=3824 RepID=A0AAN9LIV7_CANGL